MNVIINKSILIISFMLLTLAIPYTVFQYIKAEILDDTLKALQTVNTMTNKSIDVWVNTHTSTIKSWSDNNTTLIQHVNKLLTLEQSGHILKNKAINHQLNHYFSSLLNNKGYTSYSIISPNYINVSSTEHNNIGQTHRLFHSGDILQRAFKGETILTSPQNDVIPVQGNAQQLKPRMLLVSPIRDQRKNVISVLLLKIDPRKSFTRLLQLGQIGNSGETYAINKSAQLISESRFDKQLHDKGLVAPNIASILNVEIRDPGYNMLTSSPLSQDQIKDVAPLTEMAKSVLSKNSGYNLNGYRDYLGIPVIGLWTWNTSLDIGIATEISSDEAFRTLNDIKSVILVSSCLNVLLIVLLVIKFIQQSKAEKLLSVTDSLTGLGNKRMLDAKLAFEFSATQRNNTALSILMIDIDFFKSFNDTLGHLAGDEALKCVATSIKNAIKRETDLVARFGGEEFCVVLPHTSSEQAVLIAEKIRQAVIDQKLSSTKQLEPSWLTVSVGVASYTKSIDTNVTDILARADKGLYLAKNNGRNCVRQFTAEI